MEERTFVVHADVHELNISTCSSCLTATWLPSSTGKGECDHPMVSLCSQQCLQRPPPLPPERWPSLHFSILQTSGSPASGFQSGSWSYGSQVP
jgi:hypothetical protein